MTRYDIAAIKLETPIVGANVAALVRPDADLGASGLELQVAGFGETETAFISKARFGAGVGQASMHSHDGNA